MQKDLTHATLCYMRTRPKSLKRYTYVLKIKKSVHFSKIILPRYSDVASQLFSPHLFISGLLK